MRRILSIGREQVTLVSSQSGAAVVSGVRGNRRSRSYKRPRRIRRLSAAHVVWSGILRVLQRRVHYKKSDRREFKLAFSVRDLLSDSSRAVKAQFESLVQAVQRAGKYPAKEEATRAVHAVMDALKDRLPPDVLSRVADSLPLRKGSREDSVGEQTGDEKTGLAQRDS